jgi:CRISPR-associated protein (TIGR03984 family)
MNSKLFVYTVPGRPLSSALEAFGTTLDGQTAVALLYAPDRCLFATFQRGDVLRDSGLLPVELDVVYEARVFHPGAELRWRNDPSSEQAHQTAILAETELTLDWDRHEITALKTLGQEYLLWGTGVGDCSGLAPGWSRLATPRIGKLDVPCAEVPQRQHVVLSTVEYLAEFQYGNVGICEERLLALRPAKAGTTNRS